MSQPTRYSRFGLSRAWRRRLTDFMDGLYQLVTRPLRWLFNWTSLLDVFHFHGVNSHQLGRRSRRSIRRRLLTLPVQLALLPTLLVRRVVRRNRQKELLYLIPGLLMLVLFAFVVYRIGMQSDAIERRYIAGAVAAFDNKDLQLCKRYLLRTMNPDQMSAAETLSWSSMLRLNGELEKADQLLEQIAPDNAVGYGPAQRVAAVEMGQIYERTGTVESLEAFEWHLNHVDRRDLEVDRAWASFYRASGQPQQAVECLLRAAQLHPELYLVAAEIARQTGLPAQRQQAIDNADRIYTQQVLDRPFDIGARMRLAETRVRQGRLDEADKIIMEGLSIEADPFLRRFQSDLYVRRSENQTGSQANDPAGLIALVWLERAIQVDPENPLPLLKLMAWLANLSPDRRDQLNVLLFDRITGDHPTAFDYFLLAHLDWQAGNATGAEAHLDHAWRLDPNFSQQGCRLALAAADEQFHTLEWSLLLARRSVEQAPELQTAQLVLNKINLQQQPQENQNGN